MSVAEAAIAETTAVAEAAAVAEAIAEAAVAEGSIEEPAVPERSAVAKAADAREVDELSMGLAGRANDVSRLQFRGPRLDIEISRIGIQRRFGDIGQRRASERHDTRRGNRTYSKGTQQGPTRQLVHSSFTLIHRPSR